MAYMRCKPEQIPPFKSQIILNESSNQFFLGDRIEGHVIISTPKDMITNGLIVSLAGQVGVNFKEGIKSEQFLEEFKVLFGNVPQDQILNQSKSFINSCKKKMLKGGTHKFPFYFDFGKKDLPMSFSSPNGSIKYQIILHVIGEHRLVSKAEKTIQLNVPTISLLNDPSLSKPLIYKAGRQNLKILFKLEKKLLLPKQDLSFTLEIYNVSNAKATISLIQKLDFKATLETKTIKKKIWSVSNDYFEVYWTDFFKTPEAEIVPPTNFGCDKSMRIIDVNYFIKLEVESNEPDKSMKAEIPIKIGFPMPILKEIQNQNPSTNRGSNEPNTSRYSSPPVPAVFQPPLEEAGPSSNTHIRSKIANSSAGGFQSQHINPVLAPAYSELSLFSLAETLPPPYDELSTRKLSF